MDNHERITIEEARDGHATCKIFEQGKWSYLYSRYEPKRSLNVPAVECDKSLICLGVALGYELELLAQKTNKPIYVIEKNLLFKEFLEQHPILSSLLNRPNIHFYWGNEYRDLILDSDHIQIHKHQITKFDPAFYYFVVKHLSEKKKNRKEKILFFQHPTIADDCISALQEIGYDVCKHNTIKIDALFEIIKEETPDYLFSINFQNSLFRMHELLGIPYICWVVDTPSIPIYSKALCRKGLFIFSYDRDEVKTLQDRGMNNIYHMPVAANPERFNQIEISLADRERYWAEVSFLGSSGVDNEFNNSSIEEKLSDQTRKELNKLFLLQSLNNSQFIIRKAIPDYLYPLFRKEALLEFDSPDSNLLSAKEKLSFLIAKKYNEMERTQMIRTLSEQFDFKVYGDSYWKNIVSLPTQFMGYAKHFEEMPKVFKLSKININIIRAYVASGLPMRVFDVLGCKGFLASNSRDEIADLFIPGKELVLYRDLEDLCEIIEHYLYHEDQRMEIAKAGYEKVLSEHTFQKRLKTIMSFVNSSQQIAKIV